MNDNQNKVYDWLIFTSSVESTGVGVQIRFMSSNAPISILQAWSRLTDLEQDEVIQKAIVEVDGEKAF